MKNIYRKIGDVLQILTFLFLLVAVIGLFVRTSAQEHDPSYPQTRTWILSVFNRQLGGGEWKHTVRVVDTAGVCLYILDSDAPSWESTRSQMVAVPKTQLPKGAGCQ